MGIVRSIGRAPSLASALFEAVKFEHTIFALPFAYMGMIIAAGGIPTLHQFVWITLAMVGGRTMAMSANRLFDQEIDAINPRTAKRPLQRGAVSIEQLWLLGLAGAALYFISAWRLNPFVLMLSPLGAIVLAGYSFAKRFTWLTHYVLGLADGIAPVGAWFAVTGNIAWEPVLLGVAVGLWIAGFDILYACQDIDFDRRYGVHSIPARFGLPRALAVARWTHGITAVGMLAFGLLIGIGPLYWVGWLVMALLLAYEHSLVKPHNLSRLNVAFFNVNGYISIAVFVFTMGGVLWR